METPSASPFVVGSRVVLCGSVCIDRAYFDLSGTGAVVVASPLPGYVAVRPDALAPHVASELLTHTGGDLLLFSLDPYDDESAWETLAPEGALVSVDGSDPCSYAEFLSANTDAEGFVNVDPAVLVVLAQTAPGASVSLPIGGGEITVRRVA